MMDLVIDVKYQYVYDLYYRVRHADLRYKVYQLSFLDWIKAGVAFNTRSTTEPLRKVAYFAEIYELIGKGVSPQDIPLLSRAITFFYEDLFQLYQDHLRAQLNKIGRVTSRDKRTMSELILRPSFESTPELLGLFDTEIVDLEGYTCKNIDSLRDCMATLFAEEDSLTFKCMSLLFDNSICFHDTVVLLEVR